jgi:glyoxylase-like metal-dependent hydrolase (beta-lactamase superfamily II)
MANALESELLYVFGDRSPATGAALPVTDGVAWLRMRLPFALDHINLWLLRDHEETAHGRREGWAVVDCGIDNDDTRAAWEQVFADELQGLPVLRVICTHMHPDHIGLAHWLTERWQCRLWISATDWNAARSASTAIGDAHSGQGAADFFARHGLNDPTALARVRARSNYYASMVKKVPGQFRRLMHGMRLRIGDYDWQCLAGYGHAPEHIALHCETLQLLVSGDMVLPRISTNVSVTAANPGADSLGLFLRSIDRYAQLPADTLVLPSHGRPFRGLQTRTAQLSAHHRERCEALLAVCDAPKTAWELAPTLFPRELDTHQTMFAMGEAIAHLNYLEQARELKSVEQNGAIRFVRLH